MARVERQAHAGQLGKDRKANAEDVAPTATICPRCETAPVGGSFCRNCGSRLSRDPASTRVAAGAPLSGGDEDAANGGSDPSKQALRSPPWPPLPQWIPAPTQLPSRSSTSLAAGLSVVVLLIVLALGATIILLVANGDSGRTTVVTQPAVTAPVDNNGRPSTP